MKILILANDSNGLLLFREELIKELLCPNVYIDNNPIDSKKNEVIISVPDTKEKNKFEDIGCKVIISRFKRNGKNPINDLLLSFQYIKIIRKYKPNIILTYTIKPNIYGGIASYICRKPYITNITGLGTSIYNDNFLSKIIKKLYYLGVKKSSAIFVQNEHNLKFFKKNILKNENYLLIPGSGINLSKFAYKKYPEKQRPIKFLTIGRIMRDKGIDELLSAIQRIKIKFGDRVEFNLAGSFDEVSYKIIIDELNNKKIINYLGQIDNVPQIIGDYHCIIHPSYHEGLSNVLLEAGASGRPVIASDIPGCSETFVDNLSGLAIKVKDSDDLTRKIEEFIRLPYEQKSQMGFENRRHVEKKFDRKIVVNKYLECIKKYAK